MEANIRELAGDLQNLFDDLSGLIKTSGGDEEDSELQSSTKQLGNITDPNQKLTNCNFPVYGVMKAGKSTLLASYLGEKILPEQVQAMTSIPIRVGHKQSCAHPELIMDNYDKWNQVVKYTREQLLISTENGDGINHLKGEQDERLYEIEKAIEDSSLVYKRQTEGKEEIRFALDKISHFVRYLWNQNIPFEEKFDMPITITSLPTVNLNMRAFTANDSARASTSSKDFHLVDTPGPNEAGAMEALVKIGPEMLAGSVGCLFCVPFNQFGTNDCNALYTYINKNMKGKTVHIVITQVDNCKGSTTEIENIERQALDDLKPIIRDKATVTSVSGYINFLSLQIQDFLDDSANDDDSTFIKNFENNKFFPPFLHEISQVNWDNMKERGELVIREQLKQWTIDNLKKYNYYVLLEHLNDLYTDSEMVALRSHYNSISEFYEKWNEEFAKIQEFAASGAEKQEILQNAMNEIHAKYEAIYNELESLPQQVNDAITGYFEEFRKEMHDWAQTQKWTVVTKNCDGETVQLDTYDFDGGKPEVRTWIASAGTPLFISAVKGKLEPALENVAQDLPPHVHKLWEKASQLIVQLEEVYNKYNDGSDANMDDLQIFFELPPAIVIDVNSHLQRLNTFDTVDVIDHCTTELPDKCILNTKDFQDNIVKQFCKNTDEVCKLVTGEISTDLDETIKRFVSKVEREKESAKRTLSNMEEMLKSKLSAADLEEGIKKIENTMEKFETKLSDLKGDLYQA